MTNKDMTEKSPANNKATLIKTVIIAGTFVAIAALSIIARGLNGESPSASVIAARILLLSGCTVIYFWMLYYTRSSRQNNKPKPQTGKKKNWFYSRIESVLESAESRKRNG